MSDIDNMLQGIDDPTASPAQQNQGTGSENQIEQQSPEEVEFNGLQGSVQERIRRLANERRDLKQRLENLERLQSTGYVPPAPGSNRVDPQEQAAIQALSQKGIATDEKVQKTVDDKFNILRWEMRQQALQSRYTGQNDEPQYVREEVEDYIRSHPQYATYDAEDVFRDHMFRNEFLDIEAKKRGQTTAQTQQRSSTLKPTRTQQREEALTPEYINERANPQIHPDGLQWYNDHLDEINAVMAKMQG